MQNDWTGNSSKPNVSFRDITDTWLEFLMIVTRINYTINFTIIKKSMGWRRYFTISSNISFFTTKVLWNTINLWSKIVVSQNDTSETEQLSVQSDRGILLSTCFEEQGNVCRKFPEIRSLSYFKRINGLEFWCLQIPLKVVTFWDQTKLAKSCPANFVPLKKFRVRNNERVTPSGQCFGFEAAIKIDNLILRLSNDDADFDINGQLRASSRISGWGRHCGPGASSCRSGMWVSPFHRK